MGIQNKGYDPLYRDFNLLEQEQKCLETIEKALELGLNFFDLSGDSSYHENHDNSEHHENCDNHEKRENTLNRDSTSDALLGKAVGRYGRNNFIIAKKFSLQSKDVNPRNYEKNSCYRSEANSIHSPHSPHSPYTSYSPNSSPHSPNSPNFRNSTHSPSQISFSSPHSYSNNSSPQRPTKNNEEKQDENIPRNHPESLFPDNSSPFHASKNSEQFSNSGSRSPQNPNKHSSNSKFRLLDVDNLEEHSMGDISSGLRFSPAKRHLSPKKEYPRKFLGISETINKIIRTQLEQSLRKLGTDYLDLFYLQESDIDCDVIEEIMDCLKSLIFEKKILYIGISCKSSDIIRRAHSIHPVSALFADYSLQSRSIEVEEGENDKYVENHIYERNDRREGRGGKKGKDSNLLSTVRELGIGIIAKNPLGTGFLSGKYLALDELPHGDWRGRDKRFAPEQFSHTAHEKIIKCSDRHNCTPNQLALAWLLSRGNDIFPLIETKSSDKMEETFDAIKINLNSDNLEEIGCIIDFETNDKYETICPSTFSRFMN